MSARQDRKIAWVTRVPLGMVSVRNAVLAEWLSSTATLPTYLLLRSPDPVSGEKMSHGGIISKLRVTYADLGVRFSVTSKRPDRILICVSSSKETTKLEPEPSSPGPSGCSKPPSTFGEVVLYPGGIDDMDLT